MATKQTKSKQRVREHGEVFTAPREVKAMCDLVPIISEIDATVLEPTCGNGNFLVEILARKLKTVEQMPSDVRLLYAIRTLTSIYGIDLMPDNVEESRQRMERQMQDYIFEHCPACQSAVQKAMRSVRVILRYNIQQGNTLEGNGITITQWHWDAWGVTRSLWHWQDLFPTDSLFQPEPYKVLPEENYLCITE